MNDKDFPWVFLIKYFIFAYWGKSEIIKKNFSLLEEA